MKFEDALHQLPVEKKARRLKVIWPLIEAKLALTGLLILVILSYLTNLYKHG